MRLEERGLLAEASWLIESQGKSLGKQGSTGIKRSRSSRNKGWQSGAFLRENQGEFKVRVSKSRVFGFRD